MVVVIDIGIDLDYVDLVLNIWVNIDEIDDNGIDDDNNGYVDDVYGWDFDDDNNDFDDKDIFYGIYVVGIIGVIGNNDIGVVGVNYNV